MMGAPERIGLIKEGLAALDGPSLDAATAKLQRTRVSVPATNLDPEQVPAQNPCCFPIKHSSYMKQPEPRGHSQNHQVREGPACMRQHYAFDGGLQAQAQAQDSHRWQLSSNSSPGKRSSRLSNVLKMRPGLRWQFIPTGIICLRFAILILLQPQRFRCSYPNSER